MSQIIGTCLEWVNVIEKKEKRVLFQNFFLKNSHAILLNNFFFLLVRGVKTQPIPQQSPTGCNCTDAVFFPENSLKQQLLSNHLSTHIILIGVNWTSLQWSAERQQQNCAVFAKLNCAMNQRF